MFIQPESENLDNDKATYFLGPKSDVDKWQVKELKYSKAYTKQLWKQKNQVGSNYQAESIADQ